MAEKKTTKKSNVKKNTKKQEVIDQKHDISITLMTGVLVVLAATAAIAVACIYCLNNI